MQNHQGSQQRRRERRDNKRVARARLTDSGALRAAASAPWSRPRPWRTCPAPPASAACGGWTLSSDLQVAIQDLRNALSDELGGNDDVRDCAFEVVAAYDRAIAARATHCARCNSSTAPELVADQLPHHCEVTIQAKADFSYALVEGIEAAGEQGIEYTNRDRA